MTFTDAPIFDADQHMYETPESLTKYLPEKYSRAVQFAQIGRQTRIVINNRVNDFIPNPTFERVAAPGAHEKFFAGENTEGLTLRELQGSAIEAPAATRNPVDRVKELDRQRVVEALNYPTLPPTRRSSPLHNRASVRKLPHLCGVSAADTHARGQEG